MRKLTELLRSLSAFLADPAGHVDNAWTLIKGAIDPTKLSGPDRGALKNAIVTIDNTVAGVVYFLKQKQDEPEQAEIPTDSEKGAAS